MSSSKGSVSQLSNVAAAASTDAAGPPSGKNKRASLAAKIVPKTAADLMLETFQAHMIGNQVVSQTVQRIVDIAFLQVKYHWLSQVAQQKVATEAIQFLTDAVEWQLSQYDGGEKLHDSSSSSSSSSSSTSSSSSSSSSWSCFSSPPDQNWSCEPEPECLDLDRWARGVVPIKAKDKEKDLVATQTLNSTQSKFTVQTGSNSASHSRRSSVNLYEAKENDSNSIASTPRVRGLTLTNNTSSSPSSTARPSSSRGNAVIPPLPTSPSHNSSSPPSRGGRNGATQPLPEKIIREVSKEEKERERERVRELKKLEEKRRLQQQQMILLQKEKEERERVLKLTEELRGKNYTFHPLTGEVVLVNQPSVDNLPTSSPSPPVGILDFFLSPADEEDMKKKNKNRKTQGKPPLTPQEYIIQRDKAKREQEKANAQKNKASAAAAAATSAPGAVAGSSKAKSRKDGKGREMANLVELAVAQPSIVATIQLAPGVSIVAGDQSKSNQAHSGSSGGGGVPASPNHANLPKFASTNIAELDSESIALAKLSRKQYLHSLEKKRQLLEEQQQQRSASFSAGGGGGDYGGDSYARDGQSPEEAKQMQEQGAALSLHSDRSLREGGADSAHPADDALLGKTSTPTLSSSSSTSATEHARDAHLSAQSLRPSLSPTYILTSPAIHFVRDMHARNVSFNEGLLKDPEWGLANTYNAARRGQPASSGAPSWSAGGGGSSGGGSGGSLVPVPPKENRQRFLPNSQRTREKKPVQLYDAPPAKPKAGKKQSDAAAPSSTSNAALSPVRSHSFTKIPAVPSTIHPTEKARLFFGAAAVEGLTDQGQTNSHPASRPTSQLA